MGRVHQIKLVSPHLLPLRETSKFILQSNQPTPGKFELPLPPNKHTNLLLQVNNVG